MLKQKILLPLLLLTTILQAQDITLSGYIKDAANGEALIGATVYIPTLKQGTASNSYGFYSLTVPTGTYRLTVSYIGYITTEETVEANENQNITFSLKDNSKEIDEVVVSAEAANANVERVEMG